MYFKYQLKNIFQHSLIFMFRGCVLLACLFKSYNILRKRKMFSFPKLAKNNIYDEIFNEATMTSVKQATLRRFLLSVVTLWIYLSHVPCIFPY